MEGITATTPTFFIIENFIAATGNGSFASVNNSKKPKRGYVFCSDCGHPKQLFKSQKEAEMFIRYNSDTIMDESGFCPVRAYYCEECGGWHVTSQSKSFHDNNKMAYEKAQLRIQHKRDMARRQNTEEKLDKVEEFINYAIGNFKKKNSTKAYKQLQKAFRLFQQTMTTECFKARKLALFSRMSVCFEMCAS